MNPLFVQINTDLSDSKGFDFDLSNDFMVLLLNRILNSSHPYILVDGLSGSGKTTFAFKLLHFLLSNKVSDYFISHGFDLGSGVNIVHMDDIYMGWYDLLAVRDRFYDDFVSVWKKTNTLRWNAADWDKSNLFLTDSVNTEYWNFMIDLSFEDKLSLFGGVERGIAESNLLIFEGVGCAYDARIEDSVAVFICETSNHTRISRLHGRDKQFFRWRNVWDYQEKILQESSLLSFDYSFSS